MEVIVKNCIYFSLSFKQHYGDFSGQFGGVFVGNQFSPGCAIGGVGRASWPLATKNDSQHLSKHLEGDAGYVSIC